MAGAAALPALGDPVALAAGAGVGLCSSVIPYVCDQIALRRLTLATYALLVSLLPAAAPAWGSPAAPSAAPRGGEPEGPAHRAGGRWAGGVSDVRGRAAQRAPRRR